MLHVENTQDPGGTATTNRGSKGKVAGSSGVQRWQAKGDQGGWQRKTTCRLTGSESGGNERWIANTQYKKQPCAELWNLHTNANSVWDQGFTKVDCCQAQPLTHTHSHVYVWIEHYARFQCEFDDCVNLAQYLVRSLICTSTKSESCTAYNWHQCVVCAEAEGLAHALARAGV